MSGAIPAAMWNAVPAGAMVHLGLPELCLPSLVDEPPDIDHLPVITNFATLFPKAYGKPVEKPANFVPEPWFENFRDELRERLMQETREVLVEAFEAEGRLPVVGKTFR